MRTFSATWLSQRARNGNLGKLSACGQRLGKQKILMTRVTGLQRHQSSYAIAAASESFRGGNRRHLQRDLGVTVGARQHGFIVTSVEKIAEFDVTVAQFEHENTKARYIHVDTPDTNNTFGVAFRTPPRDSTGVAHILEHCVLCGSHKYPVRDPFFNMLKRSLQTFMNAMTASDYTCYPFSTRNEQDFNNLLGVYLDATFFPLLKENDFLQEGHRLELELANAKSSPTNPPEEGELADGTIYRSGVVYNEMKGRRSSATNLFMYSMGEDLYKDSGSCYENDSAGIPENIPDLTYQEFLKFHQTHYHPSNALFFTYGDLPVTSHLKRIDDEVTSKFEFDEISHYVGNSIHPTTSLSEIQAARTKDDGEIKISGPIEAVSDVNSQVKFCLMKRLDFDTTDEYLGLVFRVLSSLLLEGLNSPMYNALIASQLAPEYSPGCGYDGFVLLPSFSLGVQNIKEEQIPEVTEAIMTTLESVSFEGFPKKRIEAALHQIELSLKHKQTHFGLMLLQAISGAWTHTMPSSQGIVDYENAIIEAITLNEKIELLVQEMEEDSFFWQKFVRRHLLNSTEDFKAFTMLPDKNYLKKLENEEKAAVAAIGKELSVKDRQGIWNKSKELTEERERPQDVSCLPTLSMSDVPIQDTGVVKLNYEDSWLCFADVAESTNDLVYLTLLFDASSIQDTKLNMYLPLFCSLLGNVDTNEMSFQSLSLETQLKCGGFGYSAIVPQWLGGVGLARERGIGNSLLGNDESRYRQGVMIQTHCLKKNLEETLDLLKYTLTGADFGRNLPHLASLVSSAASMASSSVAEEPLGYARRWAAAPFSGDTLLHELLSGVTQVEFTNKVFQKANNEAGLGKLADIFEHLGASIFRAENLQVRVVAGKQEEGRQETTAAHITTSLQAFRQQLAWSQRYADAPRVEQLGSTEIDAVLSRKPDASYLPLQIPVHNCVAILSSGVRFGDEDSAAMTVLSQLISSNFLHTHIREKGGAYGSSASHNQSGLLTLASFYDPNSLTTLKIFEDSLKWACKGNFSQRDVDEATLSVFSSIDAPTSLSSKGMSEFLHGLTPAAKQLYREKYFSLNKQSLMAVADRHLSKFCADEFTLAEYKSIDANESLKGNAAVAIIGNEESGQLFKKANGWSFHSFN